jgi:photosystem II stability/assembly factor-like uncharacterized protein
VIAVLKNYRRPNRKSWMLAGVCLLMLAASVSGARAAAEGQATNGPPPWLGLFGVAIQPSDGAVFTVGAKGLLLTSADQGKTWKQIPLQLREGGELFQDFDLYSIRFAPSGKVGYIVGENGTVLSSADGGATWKTGVSGTTKNLMKVFPVDDQNAVAVGADGTIVRTADGGATWQKAKSPKDIALFDVDFTDKNTGFIAGEFATVLGTTDGGQTWNLLSGGNTSDFTVGPWFTINFTDPQHGMVAGLAGDIETTDDGGKTLKPAKLPDQSGTYAVALDPANKKTWAIGTGGRTFVQSAGGQWKETPRTTFNDLTDIAVAGNRAVMVGLNGTILLSDDAGEKWQAVQ